MIEGCSDSGNVVGASVLRRDCSVAPKFEGAVALILRLDVFFDFALLKPSMASSVSGSDGGHSEVS